MDVSLNSSKNIFFTRIPTFAHPWKLSRNILNFFDYLQLNWVYCLWKSRELMINFYINGCFRKKNRYRKLYATPSNGKPQGSVCKVSEQIDNDIIYGEIYFHEKLKSHTQKWKITRFFKWNFGFWIDNFGAHCLECFGNFGNDCERNWNESPANLLIFL